jgi:hypothetical protein
MDIISYIVLFLIAATFIYNFIKNRVPEKTKEINTHDTGDITDYDQYVIAAAIAMMMDKKLYRIKNIVLTGKEEEISLWKVFGRQEIMRKRSQMQN